MAIEGGTSPATTGDVQAELAGMRRDLLGGRGPGASAVEVLQHTRARIRVGAETVPQLRQRVAFQTGSARGDTDVLAHRVAEDRARLTEVKSSTWRGTAIQAELRSLPLAKAGRNESSDNRRRPG